MKDLSIKNINLSDSVTRGEEFFLFQLQIFWLEGLENTVSKTEQSFEQKQVKTDLYF